MSLNKVIRQGEQVKYLENLSLKHEKTISSLEEDIVLLLQVSKIIRNIINTLFFVEVRVFL